MMFNPMYHYVEGFRELLRGDIPNLMFSFSSTEPSILLMYIFAAISLIVGWAFLEACKNKIAAYL